MQNDLTIRVLKGIPFFTGMSDDDLQTVSSIVKEKTYRRGDLVFKENSQANTFCIIVRGNVEIVKEVQEDEETLLAVLGNGDFFGEMALLHEGPRSATARAAGLTVIYEITSGDFKALLIQAPLLGYEVMRELSSRLRNTDVQLIDQLRKKNQELERSYLDTVTAMMNALEARDPYTQGHTKRVTEYAKEIAQELGMSRSDIFTLEIGALLHDVGKIGIPDAILHKTDRLNRAEYSKVMDHPRKGRRILRNIHLISDVMQCVLSHHERFDGTGYPYKLSGKDIPQAGRIIAAADAYDAITSDRPYRPALSHEQAIAELKKGVGSQFDPDVIEAFIRVFD